MSLRVKLALSGTVLLALALGGATAYTLGLLREHFQAQQQVRVLQLKPLLNAALAVPVVQRDYASVQSILDESLADPALLDIRAFDTAGREIAGSTRPAPATGSGPTATPDAGDTFTAPLELAGQPIGTVQFRLSSADLDAAQARMTAYLLGMGALGLVVFSALLWWLSGTVTRRLQQLVDASRSIREGQYAPTLPAPSGDEVGTLVQAFAVMGAEIRRRVDELRSVNEGLEQQVAQRTGELTSRTIELDASVRALETKTVLLNRAPFAVLVLDAATPDYRILDATDALAEVYGHPREQALGQPILWLSPADAPALLARQLQTAAEGQRSVEWEGPVLNGHGEARWTRCLAFALQGEPGQGPRLALCLSDIQELWQAREDQRRLAGNLQESNKLQSVSLAIAGIAHDLNTPLGIALTGVTKIRDTLSAWLTDAPAAGPGPAGDALPRLHRTADLVARNVEKAGELVKSLKATTAQASHTEWQTLALLPLLESLLVTLSPITQRAHCEVRLSCPSGLKLHTEPGSLGQVITNLVVNATVHAFDALEGRRLTITASQVDQQVLLEVRDNGIGMNAEAAARAFSPFFTTKRASGGSGLGLFSARRVVEEVLGGTIELQTGVGQGTSLRITLPRVVQPQPVTLA